MNLITVLFSLFAFVFPISKDTANAIIIVSIISTLVIFSKHKKSKNFSMILQQPFAKTVVFFLGCLLFTIPFSSNIVISLKDYFHYFGDIAPFFAFLLLGMIKDSYTVNTRVIIHAFFAGLLIACIYAIYQFSITHSFGIKGFYTNQAYFAFVLEVAMPLVLSMSIVTQSIKKRSIYGVLLIIYAGTILLTHERGPWLGAFAGLATVLYLYRTKIGKKNMAFILMGVFLFGIMTIPLYGDRAKTILSSNYSSNAQRIHIWQYTIHMIQDHPLTGIGLGEYGEKYILYMDPMEKLIRYAPHAHNSYLMIFAEAGVIGFAAFIYLLLSFKKMFSYILREVDNTGMAIGIAGIFCSVLITSFVDNAFFTAYISKLFWLFLGVLLYSGGRNIEY